MLHLIIGGSGSGKSEYAEQCAVEMAKTKASSLKLFYVATMYHYPKADGTLDDETKMRIKKHQRQRAGKGFETIEQYTDIEEVLSNNGVYLLECMSNLLANEMYLEQGNLRQLEIDFDDFSLVDEYIVNPIKKAFCESMIDYINEDLNLDENNIASHVLSQNKHLVIVTNDVFSDGRYEQYDDSTKKYIRILGYINQKLAEVADKVTEVVAGIPIVVK